MFRTWKRFAPAAAVESAEALGQLGGSGNLEDDIDLCRSQTIEPYFLKYLPRQGSILEAGSGRGRWVFYLRRRGYDVIGIDLARSDVAAAQAFDPSIPISVADVLKVPVPDGHFSAVISLGVVEHFEEGPQAAFAEVRRVLAPGGLFFVTVPTQSLVRVLVFNHLKSLQLLLKKFHGERLAFEEYRYARPHFAALLREAGFELLECVPDDFRPPRNMGLYTDIRYLRSPVKKWELNGAGKIVNSVLLRLSPWLHCSGTLWIGRRRP